MTPKEFTQTLTKFRQSLLTKSLVESLARDTKKIVYNRVKSGEGVNSDRRAPKRTKQQRLKPLSDSYIEWRRGNLIFFRNKQGKLIRLTKSEWDQITKPRLGRFGAPARSNLTLSGQMLNAIKYDLTAKGFELFIKNNRRRKVHPKHKTKPTLTNEELAEIVSKERPFMALTLEEFRILERKIDRHINRQIRKFFS